MLLVVVGDGEAVGLLLDLADEGEDRLLPGDADLPALRRHESPGPVAVVLHHAEDGHGTAEALRHALGGLGVGDAAVDEEEVRQGQELLVPVRRPLEPAADDLRHGGVVVRMARRVLDLEAAVGALQGLCAPVDHHGGHDVRGPGVGDVEGLHPLRRLREARHGLEEGEGVVGPLGLGGGPLHLLQGVAVGHGQKLGLLPPLGDVDPDPVARPAGEGLAELLTVAGVRRDQDLSRQDGPGQVVLGGDGRQDLALVLLVVGPDQFRLPAGELPVLHMEDGAAALPGPQGDAPDVRIRADAGDDRLPLAESADGGGLVPEGGGPLELQRLRRLLHLRRQLPDELLALALEKRHCLLHPAAVLLRRHCGAAEAVAAAHVVVEAGTVRVQVPGEAAAAGGEF